jgi:hypothetical protein
MDVEEYFKRELETKREVAAIRVTVEIQGIPQLETISVFCGPGNQLCRWLALTVSQRVSNRLPRGMRRSYEHESSGIRGGFLMPGELTKLDGQVVDPHLQIKQVFKNADKCVMKLGHSFKGGVASTNVVAHGVPSNLVAPFNQRAFYPTTASSINSSGALQHRAAAITRNDLTISRFERLLHKRHQARGDKKATEEEILAAKFRVLMQGGDLDFDADAGEDLDGDGVNDVEEAHMLRAEIEFEKIDLAELQQEKDQFIPGE